MRRGMFGSPLIATTVLMGLIGAPTAAAGDNDCDLLLPATYQLESVFNTIAPTGTPPWVAAQVRAPLSPLHNLSSPPGIDLRIRSNMVASQIDNGDPYRPATPERLASDLAKARDLIVVVRDWCAP
ncbi:hypothetical protein [Mycolicibacterium rhodesiae]|uniref:Haemophore haem-binding domain-containing protein n=1 Tax=Mycolicibacterium rhodesiae TaxID=36814 RepID=A0A1X0IQ24_MYCRH|nr:hypothetical protein [Mycolicibacterium rhodesiae]MCV7347766.1 hypothetical protein [Mycolicibacterium rhodesiae]ORB50475.1 hypothetical protein BST42_19920 [Mycolicibacterium rhodesiae]